MRSPYQFGSGRSISKVNGGTHILADQRPWFKHSSKAHLGESIQKLIAKGDYESIGVFWVLVEKISWNGDGGIWLVQKKVLRNLLRLHPHRMHRVIDEMCGESMIECSPSATGSADEVMLQVKLPKWLKLQKPWGGKRDTLDTPLDTPLGGVEVKSTKNNRTPIVPKGDVTENHPRKKKPTKEVNNMTPEHEYVRSWNELVRGSFPLVEVLSENRKRALARCAATVTLPEWRGAIEWMKRDPWMTGKKAGPDGKVFQGCTIDTLMRDSNLTRYVELGKQTKSQEIRSMVDDGRPILEQLMGGEK